MIARSPSPRIEIQRLASAAPPIDLDAGPAAAPTAAAAPPAAPDEDFEIPVLTSAELDDGDFTIRWFLENFFAIGQDAILAGGMKTLKTTLAVALAIAIATGRPFLGLIRVLTVAPVLILSGESGLGVLQETARRICLPLGIKLRDIGNLFWSDVLPRFDNPAHVKAFVKTVERVRGGLVVVDPAYLSVNGDDPANMFAQGIILREISVLCRQADVTLLLIHHFAKTRTTCEIPELQDIAWSGFGEFCRQWVLASRREKYVAGTGEHKLWLAVGGSAGHNQTLAVDINEGLRTDPDGRKWEVVVNHADDARRATNEIRQEQKRKQQQEKVDEVREQILRTFDHFPDGATKTKVRDRVGRSRVFDSAWLSACNSGELKEAKVLGENGQQYDGFRRVYRDNGNREKSRVPETDQRMLPLDNPPGALGATIGSAPGAPSGAQHTGSAPPM